MSYVEFCQKAVKTAQKAGAKEVEAFVFDTRSTSVEIERGEIKTSSNITDVGLAVRAISNGKIGFAYTNALNREEIAKTAKKAVSASAASLKDKNWRRLPEKKRYPTVKNTYDKRILEVTSDKAVEFCQKMIAVSAEVDKRVLAAFGGTEVSSQKTACVNNNGVEVEDKGTALVCYLGTVARSETQVSPMCSSFKATRTYQPEPKLVAKEAARLAADALNVGKAEAGNFPVLLDPQALQAILTYTFVQSIKGDIVHRGRSIFKDKTGKKVASSNVSIYDDGTLAGGLYTGKTDLEGVPKQRTPIIEDGVLRKFIYDNYWARLDKKESTGNAGRGGGGLNLPAYCTVPSISPTNIVLKPGTASEQELVKEVKNGYYVRSVQGAHQSNPETGDFSVALAPAWRIKKGEIKHAVKGTMIAGNAYQMLRKTSLIGKDAQQVGPFISPKVVVSELNIISK